MAFVLAVEKGGGSKDSNKLLCAMASVVSWGELGEGIGSSLDRSSAFVVASWVFIPTTFVFGSPLLRSDAALRTALEVPLKVTRSVAGSSSAPFSSAAPVAGSGFKGGAVKSGL